MPVGLSRLTPVKYRWGLGLLRTQEIVEQIRKRRLNKHISAKTKAKWESTKGEKEQCCAIPVSPNSPFKIVDAHLHENAVSEKDAIGESDIWNPVIATKELFHRIKDGVLQNDRHDKKGEADRVAWSRYQEVDETPYEWDAVRIQIDEFVKTQNHEHYYEA